MDRDWTPSAERNEAELALRCAVREPVDEAAWRELWGRYYKLVQWKIHRLAPELPDSVIDELTADTFEKLFEGIHLYNSERARLSTFVLKVAENLAFDELRRRRGRRAECGGSTDQTTASIRDDRLPLDYLAEVVKRAIEILPAGDKRVIFERLLGGATVAEITRGSRWNESYVRRVRSDCLQAVSAVLAGTVAKHR